MSSADTPVGSPSFPAKWAQILYALGILFAVVGLVPRWQAESHHKSVQIVLDAESLGQWREALGDQAAGLHDSLMQANIVSLAVPELHLENLWENGQAVVRTDSEFQLDLASGALGQVAEADRQELQSLLGKGGTFLVFRTPQDNPGLLAQWKVLFGPDVHTLLGKRIVWFPASKRSLGSTGMGFDVNRLNELKDQGFKLWLRVENREGLTEDKLKALYAEWGKLPAVEGVIFGGGLNEAIGYPDLLEVSTTELRRLNWKVGYIELPERSQQKGIESTVRDLPDLTVRVMAVSPAHQQKLEPYRVLGMYSLGARERNIGVLYVRPYAVAGRPELDQEFLFSLAGELEQNGEPSTFSPARNGPPLWLTLIICVAGGAMGMLVLDQLGLPYRSYWWGLVLLPCLGAVGAAAVGKLVLFRSLLALAIGIAVPLYAFLKWVYPVVAGPPDKAGAADGLRLLAIASLASLSAGLMLAGLCSDTTFMLGLDRFRGVKILTLGTPMLIVAAFLWRRYTPKQLQAGLRSYIAVYQAILAGLLLAVLGILYLRTGNDAGAAASDSERVLRVLLDRVLGVRPRFKEFLMAHPALMMTPLVARVTGFLPSLILVLLAGIGQAGIVDTFAHVHTPLEITLIRVFLGVLFGAVFGLLGVLVVGRLYNALQPKAPASGEA